MSGRPPAAPRASRPGRPARLLTRVRLGEPAVGGGQHVGQVPAPDLDGRRREHAQQQVGCGGAGRRGQRAQPARAQPGRPELLRGLRQRQGRAASQAAAPGPGRRPPAGPEPGRSRGPVPAAAPRAARRGPCRARPAWRTDRGRTPRPARSRPRPDACTALPSPGSCTACPGRWPAGETAACRSRRTPPRSRAASRRPAAWPGTGRALASAACTRRHCAVVSGSTPMRTW